MSAYGIAACSVITATRADYRNCADLRLKQLAEHGIKQTREKLLEIVEDVLANPTHGFFALARENGRPIGIAYYATILSAEHCGLSHGWRSSM